MSSQRDYLSLTSGKDTDPPRANTTPQALNMSRPDGDPWDWSVEKVNNFVSSLPIPHDEVSDIADSVQRHGANGGVLLTAIEDGVLRNFLVFEIFKNRVIILTIIVHLQVQSPKYKTHISTRGRETVIKDNQGKSRRRLRPEQILATDDYNPLPIGSTEKQPEEVEEEALDPILKTLDPDLKTLKNWDPGLRHLLEKYMPDAADDETNLLSLYGDSTDDDEDEEELEEVNEERKQECETAQESEKSKTELKSGEIEVIIDNATTEMINAWTVNALPRLRVLAREIWTQSRSNNDTKDRLDHLEQFVKRLTKRRDSVRSEIAALSWTNAALLKVQCGSLQSTVEDLELYKWEWQLLQEPEPPEEVLPPPPTRQESLQRVDKHNKIEKNGEEASDGESLNGDDLLSDDDDLIEDDSEIHQENLEDDAVTSTIREHNELQVPQEQYHGVQNSPLTNEDGVTENLKRERMASDLGAGLDREPKKAKRNVPAIPNDSNTVYDNIINLESSDDDPTSGTVEAGFSQAASEERFVNRAEVTPQSLHENKSDSQHDTLAVNPVDDTKIDSSAKNAVDPFVDPTALARMKRGTEAPFPALSEVDKIHNLDCDLFIKGIDRARLITWIISHTPSESRLSIGNYISCESRSTIRKEVWKCLEALKKQYGNKKIKVEGLSRKKVQFVMRLACWFIEWCHCTRFRAAIEIPLGCIEVALREENTFQFFHDLVRGQLKHFPTP